MMQVLLADKRFWLRSALQLLVEQKFNARIAGEADNIPCLLDLTKYLRPDLILLDGHLPGLDAPMDQQLIALLRAMQPQIYIILLVNRSEESPRYAFMGVDAVVSTEEPPDFLHDALLLAEQTINAQRSRSA
jgi:DNA-binding NarL/FixJ family response regulator